MAELGLELRPVSFQTLVVNCTQQMTSATVYLVQENSLLPGYKLPKGTVPVLFIAVSLHIEQG